MIARSIAFCTRYHWLIIALALLVAFAGELARRSLPRDAISDLADPQVGVVVEWMGHPASEVAERVTKVLTSELDGLAGPSAVRGSAMAGMAYVDVVFSEKRRLEECRAALAQRIERTRAKLPPEARLTQSLRAASTGWVFQYLLVDPTRQASLLRMTRLQDTLIRPALLQLPGVAEVASVGGNVQQALVAVSSTQLREHAAAFSDVVTALRPSLQNGVEADRLRFVPITSVPELEGRTKPYLGDLAQLSFGGDMLTGYADFNGELPALGVVVVAERDANPDELVPEIQRTLRALAERLTPSNVPHQQATIEVVTAYDRLDLVQRVSQTLTRALVEEIAVVVLVIAMFLLHFRSALLPLATLPFVLLLTFGAMWLCGLPATIMSLGGIGIALGMAVDSEVVALEACHRRLEQLGETASEEERRRALGQAGAAFSPAIITSLSITALSFLPVLAFTGEAGRLLKPLAISKTLVLAAAAVTALTLAPALRARLLRGKVRRELDNPLTAGLVQLYRPFVHFALRRPELTLLCATLVVLSCLPVVKHLGREFLPRIDEGDLLFMPTTAAGVTLGEAAEQLARQDRAIKRFDEVESVFGKVGRAATATDPAPLSMAETTIRLRPRSEWPAQPRERWYSQWAPGWLRQALGVAWPERSPRTTAELVAALDRATRLPGWTNAFTTPVRARMDMLATGVHTPVGIRIIASSAERLERLGAALESRLKHVEGTKSAVFEELRRQPWPRFQADDQAIGRYHLDPEVVRATAELVLSGGALGDLAWQGESYRLRVTHDAHSASGFRLAEDLRNVTVRATADAGAPVPLALVGRPTVMMEPAQLRSEGGSLAAYVYVDLEPGVDPASYVERARPDLERATAGSELSLRPGERLEWTGEYELMARGERRLLFIVPLVLLSMLGLLFLQFRSLTEAAIVLLSIPFALVGSVWTLYWSGYALSAPVWVGLLSTAGLAMQTGVVMVVYIDAAFYRRLREGRIQTRRDIVEAHAEGTVARLRPKVMTIATMAAGLLPLLWLDGAGAEVMRRVAAPMLGGLATSAFLTLEVIPVVYTLWRSHQLKRAERRQLPLAQIVGDAPAWARS